MTPTKENKIDLNRSASILNQSVKNYITTNVNDEMNRLGQSVNQSVCSNIYNEESKTGPMIKIFEDINTRDLY